MDNGNGTPDILEELNSELRPELETQFLEQLAILNKIEVTTARKRAAASKSSASTSSKKRPPDSLSESESTKGQKVQQKLAKNSERYIPQFKKKVLDYLNEQSPNTTPENLNSQDSDNWESICEVFKRKPKPIKDVRFKKLSHFPNSISKAARKFDVHKTTISDWVYDTKRQVDLKGLQQIQNHNNTPVINLDNVIQEKYVRENVLEKELIDWLQNQRLQLALKHGKLMKPILDDLKTKLEMHIDYLRDKYENQNYGNNLEEDIWVLEWCIKFKRDVEKAKEPELAEEEDLTFDNEDLEDLSDLEFPTINIRYAFSQVSKRTHCQYSPKFKLEALEYANVIGQRATSRLLEVSQRRICDWRKCEQKIKEEVSYQSQTTNISDFGNILDFATPTATILENDNLTAGPELISSIRRSTRVMKAAATFIPSNETEDNESDLSDCSVINTNTEKPMEVDNSLEKSGKLSNGARISTRSSKQVLDVEVEASVFDWVQSLLPSKATSKQIRSKALELYREKGHTKIQCSYGWYRRWADRFNWSLDPHGDTDPAILIWLLQQYDNNKHVSYASLQKYAQDIVTKYKSDFKASMGWAMRFFKRHHIFVNWYGYYPHNLPPVLQDKVEDYVTRLRNNVIPGYPQNRIGCLDEIPISFSAFNCNNNCATQPLSLFPPAKNSDEDVSETKMPRAKKITVNNCDATVLLAMLGDGTLLPPFVIIKDDKKSVINRAFVLKDIPVVVFYNGTTAPTQCALKTWLDTIWIPSVPTGSPSLLLWDSYEEHDQVAEQFEALSVKTEMFPAGSACKLQPLGVCAKVEFMKSMEDHWENYLKQNCSKSNVKLPSTNEVINWVYETYFRLRSNNYGLLKDSFRRVRLLNDTKLVG